MDELDKYNLEDNKKDISEIKDLYNNIYELNKQIKSQFKAIKEQTDICLYKQKDIGSNNQYIKDDLDINNKLMDDLEKQSNRIRKTIGNQFISLLDGDISHFKKRMEFLLSDIHKKTMNNLLKNIFIGDYDKGSKGVMGGLVGKFLPDFAKDKFDPLNLGQYVGGAIKNMFSGLNARATGGPVEKNKAYIVGEYGPEIFIPKSNGRVNNSNLGNNINIHLNINTPNVDSFRKSQSQIINDIYLSLNAK